MARLDIDQLVKRYGDFHAVRDVSLAVADGEFLVLLGPSGCGKTTTLRMVAGFIEPTSGRVRLAGQDVTLLPPWKRNAGMVFQSYALFPHLTVAQNVALPLALNRIEPALPRVQEVLAAVGLGDRAASRPRELSGGELQRGAIARALAHRPLLVRADEPTGNGDPETAERVLAPLREAIRTNDAIGIRVTHSREAAASADRVLTLGRDGRLHAA